MTQAVILEPNLTAVGYAQHSLDLQRLAVDCPNYDEYHGTLVAGVTVVRTSTTLLAAQSAVPVLCSVTVAGSTVTLLGRFFWFEGAVRVEFGVGADGNTPITVICS